MKEVGRRRGAGEVGARPEAVLLAPCVGSAAWSATLATLGVRGQDGRCCMQVKDRERNVRVRTSLW